MTIPYTLGIPASGDNPSVDQPNMLINNDSNSTIWAVDHVTFGVSTADNGTHKQITFSSNNTPAIPTTPPVLFTAPDGSGVPQLVFYTGTAAQSANQYTGGANGSTLLTAGMILKWGSSSRIGSSPRFTFAAAGLADFPHTCFSVVVVGNANAYTGGFIVKSPDASGFTVTRTDGGSGNTGYYFIAIGN